MDTQTEPQRGVEFPERRQHLNLRAIYPDARQHIDHIFHNRHDWAGSPIDFVAHRIVHETYPYLDSNEVRVLVGAIERVHQQLASSERRN